ncbi:MAG: NAD(+) diphosphatase [Polyangiales bacterium]
MSLPVFPGATPAFAPAIGAVPSPLPPEARVLAFDGAFLVVRAAPTTLPDEALPVANLHHVGTLDGAPVVAGTLEGEVPEGHRAMDLRGLASTLPAAHWAAAAYAAQVLHWDRTHRFCGACGRRTVPAVDPTKRAKVCEGCGHEAYPRVSPCTITAIHDGSRLLLVRAPHFPPGRFGLVAGFVDPGESLEDCVRREAREEVGLTLTEVSYLGSQPWPFPHQLMVGFVARAEPVEPRLLDGELAEAGWFAPDALPQLPPRLSIARALIEHVAATLPR